MYELSGRGKTILPPSSTNALSFKYCIYTLCVASLRGNQNAHRCRLAVGAVVVRGLQLDRRLGAASEVESNLLTLELRCEGDVNMRSLISTPTVKRPGTTGSLRNKSK